MAACGHLKNLDQETERLDDDGAPHVVSKLPFFFRIFSEFFVMVNKMLQFKYRGKTTAD